MPYRIKEDCWLFEEFCLLGGKFAAQGSIVQDDMVLSEEQLTEWNDQCYRLLGRFEDLRKKTPKHVMSDFAPEGGF